MHSEEAFPCFSSFTKLGSSRNNIIPSWYSLSPLSARLWRQEGPCQNPGRTTSWYFLEETQRLLAPGFHKMWWMHLGWSAEIANRKAALCSGLGAIHSIWDLCGTSRAIVMEVMWTRFPRSFLGWCWWTRIWNIGSTWLGEEPNSSYSQSSHTSTAPLPPHEVFLKSLSYLSSPRFPEVCPFVCNRQCFLPKNYLNWCLVQ